MILTETQQNRLNKLITLVTLRVDEYTENAQQPVPDVPVGDIENELDEAAKSILRTSSRTSALSATVKQYKPVAIDNDHSTIVPLADDYLRFISVKLEGWSRPATDYVNDTSRVYQQQIYEQRRGTKEKPIAALIPFLEDYNRYYEQNTGTYQNTDPAIAANVQLTLSGWDYTTGFVSFTIDGLTVRVGGFDGTGNFSGSQAAQNLSKMLNGEYIANAQGYDQLPDGFTASFSSNVLTISRDKKEYNPIALSLSTEFTNQITVSSQATQDGFSAAPIPGDVLSKDGGEVGEVSSVDTDDKSALLTLDDAFLNVGDTLTPASGKYEIVVSGLKSRTFSGATKAKRALECFPEADAVSSVIYVPFLKSWELPDDYEDALIWKATGNVLLIMRQGELAKNAMAMGDKVLAELNSGSYGEQG